MRSLQRKIKPCYRLLNKAVAHHNKPVNALTFTGFVRLMADCQTTGGYPKIAQVIQADLPRLAQMPPRVPLQFELITLEQAEEAYFTYEQQLRLLELICR